MLPLVSKSYSIISAHICVRISEVCLNHNKVYTLNQYSITNVQFRTSVIIHCLQLCEYFRVIIHSFKNKLWNQKVVPLHASYLIPLPQERDNRLVLRDATFTHQLAANSGCPEDSDADESAAPPSPLIAIRRNQDMPPPSVVVEESEQATGSGSAVFKLKQLDTRLFIDILTFYVVKRMIYY